MEGNESSNQYQIMFQALKTGRIENIIRSAHQILRHPVIMTDASYKKLTEVCPRDPQNDPKWDVYLHVSHLDVPSVKAFMGEDYLYRMQNQESLLMNEGYFSDSPRLSSPVLINGSLCGYVSILLQDDFNRLEDLTRDMKIVADTVSIWLRNQETPSYTYDSLQQIFTRNLFTGEITTQAQLERWKSLLQNEFEGRYSVIVLSFQYGNLLSLSNYLKILIEEMHMPLLIHQSDQYLYLLLYQQESYENHQSKLNRIIDIIRKFDYNCGISRSFTSLLEIREYRNQAETAYHIGMIWDPDRHIYLYRDYVLPAILEASVDSLGFKNCIHPAFDILNQYDAENDTEYLPTLNCYIRNMLHSSATCKELNIHRNTLTYRLNKISDLTGIRLSDPVTVLYLAISFMISTHQNLLQ